MRKKFLPIGIALLLAALGLWLLSRPASVIVLIQFSFAAVLLFHGVIDLQSALSLMRESGIGLCLTMCPVWLA